MSETYGAKCHRCACLRHDGDYAADPIDWLTKPPDRLMWCADCPSCQRHSLHVAIGEAGLGIFDPEIRQAVHAFERGDDHPFIDRLRIECQALGSTVEVAGRSWFVADAQFDSTEGEDGTHLHLTLTSPDSGSTPEQDA